MPNPLGTEGKATSLESQKLVEEIKTLIEKKGLNIKLAEAPSERAETDLKAANGCTGCTLCPCMICW